ncbi:MAG: hypothetical protein HUU37_05535 [Bdellovibrionales bacterium]|nr:hypothetical protein [Bdellovibrionales bacterium]
MTSVAAQRLVNLADRLSRDNMRSGNADRVRVYSYTKSGQEPDMNTVKADRNLKIYGTNHANEDGSWQILNVLDKENQEVLLIRLGWYGT